MNFQNMKIWARLASGFGVVALLIVIKSSVALWETSHLHRDFRAVVYDQYPKISELHAIKDLLGINEVALNSMLHHQDDSDSAGVAKEAAMVQQTRQQISGLLKQLEGQITTDRGKAVLEALKETRAKYIAVQNRYMDAVTAGRTQDARSLLLQDFPTARASYHQALDNVIAYQNQLMDASITRAADAVRSIQIAILLGTSIALIISVFMALWIIRSITRPIGQAVQVANAVAAGKLNNSIKIHGSDETAQLLQALKSMQQGLVQVVSKVREGSESVATASEQIAHGNQDLSSRTESQASALQQTAASMEELNSTVRQNADNAQQANQLALSASAVAAEGGEVVADVVRIMREINDSSTRIADIIGVIDSIAFQTNILALNAAVEAARAGEQGRGFAVVATEVRSLAGRAAQAAREIKDLIGISVDRVESGTSLADQAGKTMAEVVNAIQRVTDIMGEISAASSEQSQGVAQVGEAVTQMDRVTQQNAALVEEMAAAASSLSMQAQELVVAVEVFQLDATAVTLNVKHRGSKHVSAAQPASQEAAAPVVRTSRVTAAVNKVTPRAAQPLPTKAMSDVDWESF